MITWVCLELNARAIVCSWKMENLDDLNVGVVGCIYSPNHQTSRLVEAAVAWRTGQSGAPATSPGRWGSTVGALTDGPAWLSGGAPDMPCRLSGVPPARALLLYARWRAFNARLRAQRSEHAQQAHRTVYRTCPVHHRTARRPHLSELQRSNPNGRVMWLAHRTVRCTRRQQPPPNG